MSVSHCILSRLPLSGVRRSFLNDVKRISARGYVPSEEDVVRARLRTMGVQEHRFIFEKGMYPLLPLHLFYSLTVYRCRNRT